MSERFRLPEPGSPQNHQAELPPENWTALQAYARFLRRRCRVPHILVEFCEWLWPWSSIKDLEAIGMPGWGPWPPTASAGPRVRFSCRHHLAHPESVWALREGPRELFRAVAWAEAWHSRGPGLLWGWLLRRDQTKRGIEDRADELVHEWLVWRAGERGIVDPHHDHKNGEP